MERFINPNEDPLVELSKRYDDVIKSLTEWKRVGIELLDDQFTCDEFPVNDFIEGRLEENFSKRGIIY